jgi:ankyrin repeat protein
MMLRLPDELLLAIAAELEFERDINALAQTNWRLFCCLDQLLYRRNVQRSGSSALTWAAFYGREETAKKALDSGASGIGGALTLSAEMGHEGVTKMLLSIYAPDGDRTEIEHGKRAVLWAASKGHRSIVRLLLGSEKIEIDARDYAGQTLLSKAASWGCDYLVRLLLDTGKAEIDSRDDEGRTPLSHAAEAGAESVARLLLDTGKVEVDSRGAWGDTPLSNAAGMGHESIVRLLLETGRVDIDSMDRFGRRPISRAMEGGHWSLVELLRLSLRGLTLSEIDSGLSYTRKRKKGTEYSV